MKVKKFFLIGFMGSGKSTIGKLWAEKSGFEFTDTDEEIEKRKQKSVAQIFETEGENAFRNYESEIISSLIHSNSNQIISTGGGLPVYNHLMQKLNENGITIYLKCTVDTLLERLEKNKNSRPLLAGTEMREIIIRKLNEREKIYSQATYIVNGNRTPEEVIQEISEIIKRQVEE